MALSDLQRARFAQARDALDEARALIDSGMDNSFVLTSIYYAFYYTLIALLHKGKVPETMQSVTLGLFEQQFIRNGSFPREYADTIRLVSEIKPKCSGERQSISSRETEGLLEKAGRFVIEVERFLGK